MSGHSKWSSIKHKKGAADAKRGKLFSKLSRALIVAAREGGPDPAANAPTRALNPAASSITGGTPSRGISSGVISTRGVSGATSGTGSAPARCRPAGAGWSSTATASTVGQDGMSRARGTLPVRSSG